jgi:hypothetical protein
LGSSIIATLKRMKLPEQDVIGQAAPRDVCGIDAVGQLAP